jgi:Mg-chelatase subunit ChlD
MKDQTDVTVILDRSGSMEAIASDVIGGFNQFLTKQQRQRGDCRLTLVQFDDQYEVVYLAQPIAAASRLTTKTFEPRGNTALLDAMGRTIDATGARLAALPEAERPNRVLLVIITDGEENASVEYTRDRVFSMISTQQDVYGWSFLFLAANQDAIAEAATIGIDAQRSLTFPATGVGIRAASLAMSDAVASFRSTGDAALAGSAPKKKRKVH